MCIIYYNIVTVHMSPPYCRCTCGQRRNPAAIWSKCVTVAECPKPKFVSNVIGCPNFANQSAKMTRSQELRGNQKWRRVSWKRFKLICETEKYRTAHGLSGGSGRLASDILRLPANAVELETDPVTCKNRNIIFNQEFTPSHVTYP